MRSEVEEAVRSRRGPGRSIGLTLVLALLMLFLALRGVTGSEVLETVRRTQFEYLVFSTLIASLVYFARGLRWRVLLSSEKSLTRSAVFAATMIGYFGNSYLPARAGDLIRTIVISRRHEISFSFVLATTLTERLADTLALALVGAAGLFWLGASARWMAASLQIIGVMVLVGAAGLVLAPRLSPWLGKWLDRVHLNRALSARLLTTLDRFLQGLQALANPRLSLSFAGLTLVIWMGDATASVIGANALHLSLSFWQALSLLAALGLASALPSTPGSIGIYQFVAVSVLPLFGYSPSQALAYIIVAQACTYAVVTFWGIVGLWLVRQQASAHPAPSAAH